MQRFLILYTVACSLLTAPAWAAASPVLPKIPLVIQPPRTEVSAAALSSVEPLDYVLGMGDKLRISTFGEADLSGDFEISSTGMISMPLIGDIKATGLTISKLTALVTDKLKNGYMKDPKVSIEVENYRPFFILGEVMRPGSYNYVNGMSIINAIALSGGYTYRADKNDIHIKRRATGVEEKAPEDLVVAPGDVISVPERFF